MTTADSPPPTRPRLLERFVASGASRDVLAGFLVVLAFILLLNRDLFGIGSGETWAVSYGNF